MKQKTKIIAIPNRSHRKKIIDTDKILKNVAGKKTHIFLMIDIGPNSSDLAVAYCSMFEMLMDNAEVKIERLCLHVEDMVKRTM